MYIRGSLYYEGQFRADHLDGGGKLYDLNSGFLVYDGQFVNNTMDGYGRLFYENGKPAYIGQWDSGIRSGVGTAYSESGTLIYEGGFANDLYDNRGTGSYIMKKMVRDFMLEASRKDRFMEEEDCMTRKVGYDFLASFVQERRTAPVKATQKRDY